MVLYEFQADDAHPLRIGLDFIGGEWFAEVVSFSGLHLRAGPFGHPCAAVVALVANALAVGCKRSWVDFTERPVGRAVLRRDAKDRRRTGWQGPKGDPLAKYDRLWKSREAARRRKIACAST